MKVIGLLIKYSKNDLQNFFRSTWYLKLCSYGQIEAYRHKGKLLFLFASFCSESEFSLRLLRFYLYRSTVLRFFNLCIFTDKESLDVVILPIIWFKVFFVISDMYAVRSWLVFLPTNLASLPPEVMFRMHHAKR